jgi:hypothetical protein
VIERIWFHRFKQFADREFRLHPGISLLGGGNNAGKSSILHGLAIWEFCRTAIEMERSADEFVAGHAGRGVGIGDDQFSPINVPSLKHLWSNLKTQRDSEPDGYTLKIGCAWTPPDGNERQMEFGLSLSNDRLFLKTTASTLTDGDSIPRVAYLPPFAGMTDREERQTGAFRRRRIGEGLAGAVLRNVLLEMSVRNTARRAELRGTKTKISDADLAELRQTDAWELLQANLREVFSAELDISPFREEYHSYIQVDVVKGKAQGYKLKRHPNYNKRDLMVEGSGFLQWLSVFALAIDPEIDVLMLDEPDAHLHSSLQERLLDSLRDVAATTAKQILVATHSTEILRTALPSDILHVRGGSQGGRYLKDEGQKVAMLAGLGSEYAPRIDGAKRTKRLLLVEGKSDLAVLKILAEKLGIHWPESWIEWTTNSPHKERRHLYLALKEEIDDLVVMSLRDRDDDPINNAGADLVDKGATTTEDNFLPRRWRRRYIESYLIWPPAIAAASGLTVEEVRSQLAEQHALAVTEAFPATEPPQALLDVRGKEILKTVGSEAIMGQFSASAVEVARHLDADHICDDIKTFLEELVARA